MRRNFECGVEIGDKKNALYGDIPPGDGYPLKFTYLISAKDNVFTVTKSLGMFPVS
jgi:hypothetical protein